MANIKIAQLTNQTAISDNDLIIIETATSTNKMTVGTLKDLLGIERGGIVESGSNVNGYYIKFEDGTLMCWGSLNASPQIVNAWGSLFITSPYTINFPVEFYVSIPSFQASLASGDLTMTGYESVGTGSAIIRFIRGQSLTISNKPIVWQAIGRWK